MLHPITRALGELVVLLNGTELWSKLRALRDEELKLLVYERRIEPTPLEYLIDALEYFWVLEQTMRHELARLVCGEPFASTNLDVVRLNVRLHPIAKKLLVGGVEDAEMLLLGRESNTSTVSGTDFALLPVVLCRVVFRQSCFCFSDELTVLALERLGRFFAL